METDNAHEWQSSDPLLPEDNNLPGDEEESDSEEAFEIIDSGKDEDNILQTPNQKLSLHDDSGDHHSEIDLSAGSLTSNISTKEGSEPMSSSSSSSDAESGAYKPPVKNYLLQEVDGEGLEPKNLDEEAETLHISYDELLEKVANNAAELTFTKKKLESSQEEIARLKYENLTLVEELGGTIEKLRASEDHMEKMEQNLRNKFQEDRNQLENQLNMANQSIDQLQMELDSERKLVSELQQTILKANIDLDNTREELFQERSRFQFDMAKLVEVKDELETVLKEVEITKDSLLDQIQQYAAKETSLLAEMEQMNSDLSQKREEIDSLNKQLDASKLGYDMLMADKDEVFAQFQTLAAELSSRGISIKQMEGQVTQLVAEKEKAEKQVVELRAKVADQENELKQQVNVMSERAEEKREAIRQLCFSLEYYRNGYHELCQVFSKTRTRRSLVVAS